jgi:hypothetical protein
MIDPKRHAWPHRRSTVLLFLIALSATAHAQEPKKEYAQEFTESFKNLSSKNQRWGWIWPDVANFVKYEADGVRFDLPAAPAKGRNPVGLGAKLAIKGDFEITLSYEILGETQGAVDDDGSHFGLEVMLAGRKPNAGASLMRFATANEGCHLLARVDPINATGKRALKVHPYPSKAKAGRFRMVRSGAELSVFVSEGDDKEFALILKSPFGIEDVSNVLMSAGTDGARSTLNVRLTDLRIRADAIPQKPVAMTDINKPAPKKKAPEPAVNLADLPAPNLKVKFHQDFRGGDPNNPNLRFVRDQNIKWEPEGARITMPAGQGKFPTTGVAANFQIKGDFQITASFEVLKAEQPTEGYGVGVSLYAAIDPDANDALSLARRVGIKGGINYLSDRMSPNPDKGRPDHDTKTRPSKAPTGKLRVQRVGTVIRFLFADGDSPNFVPILQNSKNRIDREFGHGDIRYFQIGGDAGNSEAELDLRLLDLTVEAEELPGLVEAAKRVPPAWVLNPQGPDGKAAPSPVWLRFFVILGASVAVLLAVGVGAWLLLRRRRSAEPAAAPVKVKRPAPARTTPAIVFACPDCGKKLRVKAETAGRKLKCPQCGSVTAVPKADAFEADRDLA